MPNQRPIHSQTIDELRSNGACVVVFTQEELSSAPPGQVEEQLIEAGWEIINNLK
jgi:hypothetical protein